MERKVNVERKYMTIERIESPYGRIELPFPVRVDVTECGGLHGSERAWAILGLVMKAITNEINRREHNDDY